MPNYVVAVVPPGDCVSTNEALHWIAQNLETALRGLGHTATVLHDGFAATATNIVLGGHRLGGDDSRLPPPGSILYNLADLRSGSLPESYWQLALRYPVWDYCPRNLEIWRARPTLQPAALLEIGYLPEMRRIPRPPSLPPGALPVEEGKAGGQDEIDVLVFGMLHRRGEQLLVQLQQAGLRVAVADRAGAWCVDALLDRAKVVLNLHCPETRLLSAVRNSCLYANSKAVLHEAPPAVAAAGIVPSGFPSIGPGFDELPYEGVTLPYERLIDGCLELLEDPAKRERLGAVAFQCISRKDMRSTLSRILPKPQPGVPSEVELRTLYLDMVQRSVLDLIHDDSNPCGQSASGVVLSSREFGCGWPESAHSMIGNRRMSNLRMIVQLLLTAGVPGDFIETGVWRGGACIMMRAVLKTFGDLDRRVWVADSFRGLPPPCLPQDAESGFHLSPQLAIPLEQVQQNFAKYGLLDDQVQFLQGWFSETLPTAPIDKLALLRLDGDMYASTMDGLTHLYDKVSPGGFIIVDDFAIGSCEQATLDFRESRGIVDPIQPIDGIGVYWCKTANPAQSI
jgi:O-methyltransferase